MRSLGLFGKRLWIYGSQVSKIAPRLAPKGFSEDLSVAVIVGIDCSYPFTDTFGYGAPEGVLVCTNLSYEGVEEQK
jgi:hypothetical protein